MGFNQKGSIQLLFIVILLIGISMTVYLTQFTQVFKPKASEARSAVEQEYNPFGDDWYYKLSRSTERIPLSLSPGCHRIGVKQNQTAPQLDEITFLSKSNVPFVFEECATFTEDSRTINYYKALSDSLASSGTKYIGYNVVLQADINLTGVSSFYNDVNGDNIAEPVPGYEDFFLYNPDGSVYKQGGSIPLLNLTNSRYKNYIIPKIADYVQRAGMGGVLIDTVYSTDSFRARNIFNESEVLDSNRNHITNMNAYFIDFMRDINSAIDQGGQDRLLFANVDSRDAVFIEQLLPFVDGLMLEDPMGSINSDYATTASAIGPILDRARALNKYVLIVVNTNANCSDPKSPNCFTELSPERHKQLNNYYLAQYLTLMRDNKTILIYYTPREATYQPNGELHNSGTQFLTSTYFRNWDARLGAPREAADQIFTGVYLRKFPNGFVYLNTTNNTSPQLGGSGLFDVNSGEEITNATIPGKTGRIFVATDVYNEIADNRVNPVVPDNPQVEPNFTGKSLAYCNGAVSRIHIEWDQVPGAILYKIFRSTSQPGSGVKLAESSNYAYNDEKVTPGIDYSYSIEAVTGSGSSSGTSKTIKADFCGPTINKSASYCLSQTAVRNHLEWTSIPGSGAYKAYRWDSTANSRKEVAFTSGLALNDDTAMMGNTYNYIIYTDVSGVEVPGTALTLKTAICN